MGYSPFNLTTLQLPAPYSNMTKAAYKDAYGIDLDDVNIKAFKLVLFNGEKYAIDQIKEVEDGIEIYFSGRILSITDDVEISDEVYNVANSKPIYIHPITIIWQDELTPHVEWGEIELLVFNNDSTPFTANTFKAYVDELRREAGESVFILANGAFQTASGTFSDGKTTIATRLYEVTQNNLQLSGMRLDDTGGSNIITQWTKITDNIQVFSDGVNKIN